MRAFSLLAASGHYSLDAVHGLVIEAASLVVEHSLWSTSASAAVVVAVA